LYAIKVSAVDLDCQTSYFHCLVVVALCLVGHLVVGHDSLGGLVVALCTRGDQVEDRDSLGDLVVALSRSESLFKLALELTSIIGVWQTHLMGQRDLLTFMAEPRFGPRSRLYYSRPQL
jgi:hypothetical protein